jgi:hypothetical protein
MDVELQILKHLARDPQQTTPIVDVYCTDYQNLFPEVRSYEYFKYLQFRDSLQHQEKVTARNR